MFLILILCTQWTHENFEAKFYEQAPDRFYARAESTHEYNVLKYELELEVPMTSRTISGINNILCQSRIDGLNTAVVHAYTLTIDSISVSGFSTTYSMSNDSLIIDLPQSYDIGDTFTIAVGYHGSWSVTSYQTGFVYYPQGYNGNTLHSLAYTLGEPWDARAWMPCYDEPSDKADSGCVIGVTVPDTFTVCANGELISVTNNPDTTTTYVWRENYPVTTYLMHFGVSKYSVWSDWFVPSSGDSVEIRHFIWPEDSVQSVTSCQGLPIAMQLYDSLYGSYPFDRYGQDAVYPYAWGGMEHQELSTIHRNWILYASENGMAHELAHMWWGDMVTCVDFRDIWLNEGCATYSDANFNWVRYSYNYFISTMNQRAQTYFQSDNNWRHPIYDPPPGEMFEYGHTYCKASWVMHMLRFLDPDNFFTAMQVYRDSFEYGTANTDDMKNIFSLVYGTDLSWFFNEWVYDQGFPEYDIFWYCSSSGNDYTTSLNIYQTQTNAPAVFHMPVQVLLQTTGSDTLIEIPINNSPEHVDIILPDSVISIQFDPDYRLLHKHQIYYGIEEYSNAVPVYNDFFFSSNPAKNLVIEFVVNQPGKTRFIVYDATGRVSLSFEKELSKPGHYSEHVDKMPAGVYFCRFETPVNRLVKKLVIID
jgi:aminopeptidase N